MPRIVPTTQCSKSRVALIDPKSLKIVLISTVRIIDRDYIRVPLEMQIFTALLVAASTVTAHCQYCCVFYFVDLLQTPG